MNQRSWAMWRMSSEWRMSCGDVANEFREFRRDAKAAVAGGRYLWIPVGDLFTTSCPGGLDSGTSIMELPAIQKRPRTVTANSVMGTESGR